MLEATQIKVLSWNVRGLGTWKTDLRAEILKQDPHVLVMQETRRWVTNDRDLRWDGATVYNIPPKRLSKGSTGGLAVIINPKLKCQLIACTNPAAKDFEASEETIDLLHLQQCDWANSK